MILLCKRAPLHWSGVREVEDREIVKLGDPLVRPGRESSSAGEREDEREEGA